jgi:hypothetical protein
MKKVFILSTLVGIAIMNRKKESPLPVSGDSF